MRQGDHAPCAPRAAEASRVCDAPARVLPRTYVSVASRGAPRDGRAQRRASRARTRARVHAVLDATQSCHVASGALCASPARHDGAHSRSCARGAHSHVGATRRARWIACARDGMGGRRASRASWQAVQRVVAAHIIDGSARTDASGALQLFVREGGMSGRGHQWIHAPTARRPRTYRERCGVSSWHGEYVDVARRLSGVRMCACSVALPGGRRMIHIEMASCQNPL